MENKEIKYSGFFSRLIALVLDTIILSIPLTLLSNVFEKNSNIDMILFIIIWWIYTSYSIYKWKGTLGKRIVGLYVLKIDTEKLSFKEASLRYFFSILIYLPLTLYLAILENIEIENEKLLWILLLLTFGTFFMIFFNKKSQTLYDYLAKTVVVDSITNLMGQPNTLDVIPNPNIKPTALQKSIRGLVGIVILIPIVYGIVYFVVMYIAFSGYGKNSNNPITSIAKTIEYNNSKINFYKIELEKASIEFIRAESMYDIFQGDVKKDLALNCIRFFLQKEGNDEWLNEGIAYRDNAINKYANTRERVKKAKKNESYMGHHFYDYDLNEVSHIEDEIANMWDINGNQKTCEKLVSVNKLFDMFIVKYVPNREEALKHYIKEYKHAKVIGTLNKSFYKKKIEKTRKWINTLYKNIPRYVTLLTKLEKEHQIFFWESIKKGKLDNFEVIKGLNIKNTFGETH